MKIAAPVGGEPSGERGVEPSSDQRPLAPGHDRRAVDVLDVRGHVWLASARAWVLRPGSVGFDQPARSTGRYGPAAAKAPTIAP